MMSSWQVTASLSLKCFIVLCSGWICGWRCWFWIKVLGSEFNRKGNRYVIQDIKKSVDRNIVNKSNSSFTWSFAPNCKLLQELLHVMKENNSQGNLADVIYIMCCRIGLIMTRKLQTLLESMRLRISFWSCNDKPFIEDKLTYYHSCMDIVQTNIQEMIEVVCHSHESTSQTRF